MSGRMSRNKGRREEQQLVLALSVKGFKAERILRQYQEAGQPDVKATREGKTITLEMKSRGHSFSRIYDLYYKERAEDGFLGIALEGRTCAISTDIEVLLESPSFYFVKSDDLVKSDPKNRLIIARLFGSLFAMKQTADFLVIRDNNKPRIYLRYW